MAKGNFQALEEAFQKFAENVNFITCLVNASKTLNYLTHTSKDQDEYATFYDPSIL